MILAENRVDDVIFDHKISSIVEIVEDLKNDVAISKIAKEYGITRQTVYRIKKDYELSENGEHAKGI